MRCSQSPRTRHLGLQSQMGLWKLYYEQSQWKWWNSRWAISKILKDDAVKVLHSLCQQIWKTQQWPQNWERSVFISVSKKGNTKDYSNYLMTVLISHAVSSKVMLKILQARLEQYMNQELLDVQAGFRKRQRNQRSNCQHPLDHRKKKGILEKHLFLLHWLC